MRISFETNQMIRLLKRHPHFGNVGDVVEMEPGQARQLIEDGFAELAKTEPRKAKRAKPENKAMSAEG